MRRSEVPRCGCGCGGHPPLVEGGEDFCYVDFARAMDAGWRRKGSPAEEMGMTVVRGGVVVARVTSGGDARWWCPTVVVLAARVDVRQSGVVKVSHVAA